MVSSITASASRNQADVSFFQKGSSFTLLGTSCYAGLAIRTLLSYRARRRSTIWHNSIFSGAPEDMLGLRPPPVSL